MKTEVVEESTQESHLTPSEIRKNRQQARAECKRQFIAKSPELQDCLFQANNREGNRLN